MPSIFTWKCSHYKNTTRKWISGSLQLRLDNITFLEEDNPKNSGDRLKLIFDFTHIQEVKKATSSLVYSSIVFLINKEQFWFSSLPNRDNVFYTIEYFWKQLLCDTVPVPAGNRHTNELLKIAHGTQDSLMEAANTLHAQGKQLNNAAKTMDMVHNDLNVAERIADDLDSYFSMWHVKGPSTNVPNLEIERDDVNTNSGRIEYSILYANFVQESHKTGYIVLNDNNINVLNEKSESVFTSPVTQLSKVDVNSPWDIIVTKRSFGKSDTCLHLISTKMPNIIQTLQKLYDIEINYLDLPDANESEEEEEEENTETCSGTANPQNINLAATNIIHSRTMGGVSGTSPQHSRAGTAQMQMTDEDNKELSKVLNNIKSMAVNISVEQDAQIKQIERLNETVDRANDRIRSADFKVKKIT